MSQALDKIAAELRSALLGADHVLANRLVNDYAEMAREIWEALPESERLTSPLPQQTRDLLTWAHQIAVAHRALASAQLDVVQKAARYGPTNHPIHGVQLRG